jgi:asparagine N-glycosylation enzyme membrane subunit Stt3
MKKISSILSILVGAFLFLAAVFLFKCPKMESGAYMNCHHANVAVAVLSGLMVLSAVVSMLARKRIVTIVSSAVICVAAVLSAIVPGILIDLCMMPGMTCRAVFRPVDVICSVVILLSAAVRLVGEFRGAQTAK